MRIDDRSTKQAVDEKDYSVYTIEAGLLSVLSDQRDRSFELTVVSHLFSTP